MTIILTGIQPTGELHLGNYAGAIRPLAELAAQPARETYVFVADLHGLNTRPPDQLRDRTRKMAAALLACGLDHDGVHIYRQSRVPAIAQRTALLSNVTSKGTLNRAHAYKALVAANTAAGRDPDHGASATATSRPCSPTSWTRHWRQCATATTRSWPTPPGSTPRCRRGRGTPTSAPPKPYA